MLIYPNFVNKRIKMRLSLFILFIISSALSFSQNLFLDNYVYKTNIKAVKMEVAEWEVSYPIIDLNSNNQLQLSFDDLSDEIKDYSYKIIHCNADWTQSSLAENEYLNGFFENQIRSPRSSFNTFTYFYHYKLLIPNNDVQLKLSGNYIIKVYEDYDESNLVLERRFSVSENQVQITANIKRAILAKYRSSHQQVDFKVLTKDLIISDPYNDIKVAVVQNNIWQLAKTDLLPQFVRDGELVYENIEDNSYMAYNEFRYFDMKSLKYLQEHIAKIFFEDDEYFVRLMDDDIKRFKVYLSESDINGAYIVRNREYDDFEVDADFAKVYFYLPMAEPVVEGDLYVFGELTNWQTSEANKMIYSYERKAYQLMLTLKQGYYNYEYVFVNKEQNIFDPQFIEGSHYETENNYSIYVYYRGIGDEYDRLIGFRTFNSVKDNSSFY